MFGWESILDFEVLTALQNYPDAQYRIGVYLEDGKEIAQNMGRALQFYRQVADQKHTPAEVALGKCYFYGKGVAKNRKKALHYYNLVATKNNPDVLYCLGKFYELDGPDQNFQQALSFYKLAVKEYDTQAAEHLYYCYKDGALGLRKDINEARQVI